MLEELWARAYVLEAECSFLGLDRRPSVSVQRVQPPSAAWPHRLHRPPHTTGLKLHGHLFRVNEPDPNRTARSRKWSVY